jgi:hypothetical protein
LLLLYFFSPTVTSLRSLQQTTTLVKVQRRLGVRRTSLGALSEAAHVFDAALLHEVIAERGSRIRPQAKLEPNSIGERAGWGACGAPLPPPQPSPAQGGRGLDLPQSAAEGVRVRVEVTDRCAALGQFHALPNGGFGAGEEALDVLAVAGPDQRRCHEGIEDIGGG